MKAPNKKPTFRMLQDVKKSVPKIVFSLKSMKWIEAMVDIHSLEVGFYGVVDVREDGSYYVRDILYPKHSEMNGATCEISPEGESDIIELLCNEEREDDIAKAKRFWGHSHHNMATSPSAQDESQAMSIMTESKNFVIRAICNKKDEMSISFFDYSDQIRFDNVPFTVEDELLMITNILSDSENLSDEEKIAKIKQIAESQGDDEKIRKKIEELKIENAPVVQHTTYVAPYYKRKAYNKKNKNNLKTPTTLEEHYNEQEEMRFGGESVGAEGNFPDASFHEHTGQFLLENDPDMQEMVKGFERNVGGDV